VDNVPESNLNGRRLVVGASRGIGLALAEAQLAEPGVTQVVATHRPESDARELQRLADLHGDRLRRVPLDVSDTTSLAAFEQLVATIDGGFDLVIHAAGILHEENIQPEKSLAECNATALARLFEVNSIGPLMVAAALLPHQGRGRRFTFAALSAMVGSISDNRLGGWYGYRASKAALNQFLKTLAVECRHRHPHATILAIHPGTTDTELSRPFQRNVRPGKLYSAAATAQRILAVVGSADPGMSGQFLNWDGSEISW
jgi:NAD(P)-dependent dehydrogenase (short-subunit alcohol dehydrogenase family)